MFETLQPAAYAVSFIFWALSTLTTGFRIYSRGWIIKAFGKDDWWMVMVLVSIPVIITLVHGNWVNADQTYLTIL